MREPPGPGAGQGASAAGESAPEAEILDISAPLSERTEPWPGDTPFRLEPTARLSDGDPVNLSRLTTSPHNGTHADAPLHVSAGAAGAAELPLAPFWGPAVVLDARDVTRLRGEALARRVPRGHRVLLRWGRTDPVRFPLEVSAVPPGWIDAVARRDVPLLGTDAPSVDPRESKELPAHHACLRHGIQVVENLVLAHVPDGPYRLVALPLRIEGADASPVRAALRPLR